MIAQVEKNSPAEKVGLLSGDIVLAINDRQVDNASDMRNFIGLMRAGSQISLRIERDDKMIEVTVTIAERNNETAEGNQLSKKLAGVMLAVDREMFEKLGHTAISVKEIDEASSAYRQGLRQGDIIISINRKQTYDFQDARRAIRDEGKPLLLHVLRKSNRLFIAIR